MKVKNAISVAKIYISSKITVVQNEMGKSDIYFFAQFKITSKPVAV